MAPDKDFKLNRFFSKPVTNLLLRTPVTPNQVTFFNLCLGLLTGFLFSRGTYAASLAGALGYQTLAVLDNCDGEIARAKNLKSELGGWLDVWVDIVNDSALFVGLTLGLLRQNTSGPVLLLGALCVTGGLIHFFIVILEKTKGFGPAVFNQSGPAQSRRKNLIFKLWNAFREGETSWLVLGFVLCGQMKWLLWLGALYMNALWLSALCLNFKWIFFPRHENS